MKPEIEPITRTLVAIVIGVLGAGCAMAQTGTLSSEKQGRIESAVSSFMMSSKVPGLSVAVVQDREFVWSAGFGMADLENSVPATSQTVYRLASISKSLTATAAMVLWERGKLDLDAPVQNYCPAFPAKPGRLTTRHLLAHIGGVRSYRMPELPYTESQSDPEIGNVRHFEDGIEGGFSFFAEEPLVTPPGAHFNYSTQGYTVVGCAIEGASGKKYAAYVRDSVLGPAGMLQTRPDDRFAVVPLRTRFYSKDKAGVIVNAEFLDSSYKVPGGGWLSSAPDMARFEVAILNHRLVRGATREAMWTQPMPSDGLGRMAYSLGWQMGVTDGVRDVGHGGSQQGTSTMILMAPESGAGVVVLTNSDGMGAGSLASDLLKIVLGLAPQERKDVQVDPVEFARYMGTYQLGDFSMSVGRDGGGLFAGIRDRKIRLFARSDHEFMLEGGDGEIVFEAAGTGAPKEMIFRESGTDAYLSRVK